MGRDLPDSKRRDKHVTINLNERESKYLSNLIKITKEKPTAILMRAMYKTYNRESIDSDVSLNYSAFITREIKAKKEMIEKLTAEMQELEEELERVTRMQQQGGEEDD